MESEVRFASVHWREAVQNLIVLGWCRVQGAVSTDLAAALEDAAPDRWTSVPPVEGPARVRQAGCGSHSDIDGATTVVQTFARALREQIDSATPPGTPGLPPFNHAEWSRPEHGHMFITPHRDPVTAEGVVVTVTLRGEARFRVWELEDSPAAALEHPERANVWATADGDIVVLRGGRWPTDESMCPIHDAQMPVGGERVTLTLRHNRGGFGTDYFG